MTITPYDDAAPTMTGEEARVCVDKINTQINGARADLLRLYEGKGWVALGYDSWRACAVAEFGQSQARVYQLLQAAEIERRVSTKVEIGTIPERRLRPLAALPEEQQAAAYEEAVETAPHGKPTAAHVAATVERFRRPEPADAPRPLHSDTEARPTAINPNAIIAPPTPFVAAVADRLVSDGGFRRNAILEEFHATCQRQMGVWQKSRDLLKHIDPAEIAALLDEDEAKSIAHVIGYTNDLLGWFQRAAASRETPAGIRRVK